MHDSLTLEHLNTHQVNLDYQFYFFLVPFNTSLIPSQDSRNTILSTTQASTIFIKGSSSMDSLHNLDHSCLHRFPLNPFTWLKIYHSLILSIHPETDALIPFNIPSSVNVGPYLFRRIRISHKYTHPLKSNTWWSHHNNNLYLHIHLRTSHSHNNFINPFTRLRYSSFTQRPHNNFIKMNTLLP